MNENDKIIASVFEEYGDIANQNILLVPDPERTLIVIYSVHGVIGNGGFRYFFENDFAGHENYNVIIDSYRSIGLLKHAERIETLISLFPNAKPHDNLSERRRFLDKYFEVESDSLLSEVDEADNFFFSDYKSAFNKALNYYLDKKLI